MQTAGSSSSASTDGPLPMIISTAYHKPSQPRVSLQSPKSTVSHIPPLASKRRPRRRRWSHEIDPMLIGEIQACLARFQFIYFPRYHDMPNPRLHIFHSLKRAAFVVQRRGIQVCPANGFRADSGSHSRPPICALCSRCTQRARFEAPFQAQKD